MISPLARRLKDKVDLRVCNLKNTYTKESLQKIDQRLQEGSRRMEVHGNQLTRIETLLRQLNGIRQ